MKDTDWKILAELHRNPNLTKVADLLYMTQPSLTKRLHNMEDEFSVEIVRRTPKGLEFTREGEYLAQRAQQYLDFMQQTRRGLDELRQNSKYQITIGSSYTFSKYRLTDLLMLYRKDHPEIEFQVENDQSNILFRRVLDGSVDVGFVRGDYDGAVHRVLIDQTPAYLVTREPVELDDLPQMQRITYRSNDRTLEILARWWRDRFGTDQPAGMSVGYIDFVWQVVKRSGGYACCFLPPQFENELGLCLTPLFFTDGSPVQRNTWFVYPKSKRLDRQLQDFIDFVTEQMTFRPGEEK